ncbi:MAG TPA: hypothetical protein VJS92_00215, partial [Candidatus Polarisedimenticolaceae bacterium]|nr:hypothetical protein [Candidatus Polarisedimenticolaceae bacterium]
LRALVAPFADEHVGAVGGELVLTAQPETGAIGQGCGLYWRYEKAIRASEGSVDSTVGATGAIYAIRRELFEPIPSDTILDDVAIPMHVARRGFRVVFEPRARAFDRPPASALEEFTRKVRTLAGNFQLLAREPWLLLPWRDRLWFQVLSHKALRLLGPLLLAGAFLASLALIADPLYAFALLCQSAFYAAAGAGALLRNAPFRPRLFAVPYTFCLLNAATAVAFWRWMRGQQRVTWARASARRG